MSGNILTIILLNDAIIRIGIGAKKNISKELSKPFINEVKLCLSAA
ncbi:MAG: hypothetical protein U0354_20215 [Candidatus Sericytochromatia bacterium]